MTNAYLAVLNEILNKVGEQGIKVIDASKAIENVDTNMATALVEMREEREANLATIADLVARLERIDGWMSAAEAATYIAASAQFVREHAVELGGVKVGEGKTAAWRFKRSLVDAALQAVNGPVKASEPVRTLTPPAPMKPRRRKREDRQLLPVRAA